MSGGLAVLIVALSARALAGSARRAGYAPLVTDPFGDLDTRDAAERWERTGTLSRGLRRRPLLATLDRLAAGRAPIGLVCGAGFEDRTALLSALGARYRLLGNSAETVARAKNPPGLAELCRRFDVPHPPLAARATGPDWLSKRIGGAGGAHIRRLRAGAAPRRGRYAQRRVDGRAVSALFLADGQASRVLGLSEQWTDAAPGRPFRYGGAARPAAVPSDQDAAMGAAISRLVPPLGLRGLNSADFLLGTEDFTLIEINPRPGATLDIHDDADGRLFAQHVAACTGPLPAAWPPASAAAAAAAAVVYAPRALRVPEGFAWPDWTADRQAPGDVLAAGAPLCTVRAEAVDVAAARTSLDHRRSAIVEAMQPA